MKLSHLPLLLTAFYIIISASCKADSIVSFSDLQFHSEFEKQVFVAQQKNVEFTYFKLFLAANKDIDQNSYQLFVRIFNNLNTKIAKLGISNLKPKKKVKQIYKLVHKNMFDKYQDDALFSAIFMNKEYQCVTASMMYSLVFDRFKVPYSINFIPKHIYLTAYPESEKIHVETTNPNKAIYLYNNKYKKKYVDFLREGKIISSSEYENKDVNTLFKEYYLKSESINKKELAGTQYVNLGIFYLQKSDYLNAYNALLKSYYLFPSDQNKYFLMASLGFLIDVSGADNDAYAQYINKFLLLSSDIDNTEIISGLFAKLTYKQLHTNGNITQYKKSYVKVVQGLTDSVLRMEIDYIYNTEMGNVMLLKNNYIQAQNYFEKALCIKKDNISLQNALISVMTVQMINYSMNLEDLRMYQTRIEETIKEFPSLLDNVAICNLRLNIALGLMEDYYQTRKIKRAQEQHQLFKTMTDQYSCFNKDIEGAVEGAYSSAAVYYYQMRQIKTARKLVEEGLSFFPNNYKLNLRLNALK